MHVEIMRMQSLFIGETEEGITPITGSEIGVRVYKGRFVELAKVGEMGSQ